MSDTSNPDSQWLSADQLEAWRGLTAVMFTLPFELDSQLQRDSGLSFFEYMVLAVVSEQPERVIRMSELAMLANGSLSRLSHVAKRLEGQGLLRREPDPTDGRYTKAILTDDGSARLSAAAVGHVATARSLVIDALDPEQVAQLLQITDRIRSRLQPPPAFVADARS